ncbi:MAG: hypothetical protein JXJ18_13675 [Rhodobacteraceae bacterium]|nr:hypothetical protein [Paracoccaceae bacterium]
MLYETDGTQDLLNVLAAIDGFAEGLGLSDLSVDVDQVEAILRGMRQDFPAQGGSSAASPFKKAANFLCYFVAQRPVKNPFPAEVVGSEIARIQNHQNVMVGLHIAVDALHNATIHRCDGPIVLSERVRMSKHSYVDTIQACSSISPSSHFHLVSVFLEQLCYRFNPTASYELVV